MNISKKLGSLFVAILAVGFVSESMALTDKQKRDKKQELVQECQRLQDQEEDSREKSEVNRSLPSCEKLIELSKKRNDIDKLGE